MKLRKVNGMSVQEHEQLWGGETTKAVANFPISGERIPVPVSAGSGASRRPRRASTPSSGCSTQDIAERIAAAADQVAERRVRRPVPDRRVPDRLGHLVEHERQRGDRDDRRRRRARERPRQHGPVLERRVPVGRAPGRARRGHQRAAPGARPARAGVRRQGGRVPRHRQGGPHPPDGRCARHARAGVQRVRGAGPARRPAGPQRAAAGMPRSRSAGPRPAPASTPTRSSPPGSAHS